MTSAFAPVWRGGAAGLAHWSAAVSLDGHQALTSATPLLSRRDYGFVTDLWPLVHGGIGQVFRGTDGLARVLNAGCVGEGSVVLILLGAVYLLATRTANWRLMLSTVGGASLAVVLFRHVGGVSAVPPLLWTLCAGGLLYGAVFMVTDPVSAPRETAAQVGYGLFIGFMVVFFRWKAVFPEGVGFAILLGNTIGPSLDLLARAWAGWRSGRVPAAAPGSVP